MNPDLEYIIKSYRTIGYFHRYSNKIKDRFGFWDNCINNLPHYSEKQLENYSIERAKELGYKNILWSGGIDSTFIICAYIKAKIPFHIICDKTSIKDGTMFYNWLIQHNYPITVFDKITQAYNISNLMHGDVADQLFSPDEKRRTNLPENILFKDNLNNDRLFSQIEEYGKLLNKPTDTNAHIIRLLNFGCFYLNGRDELYYVLFPTYRLTSFFDTQEFNNIAWTQYWDRTVEDDKPEMHRFICEITQDERMMWGVYRSPTTIPSRLERTTENYIDWGD